MKKVINYGVCLALLGVMSTTYGQDSESAGDSKIEKISVTGSRIKRADLEGTQSVLVFDKEEIERTGVTSISQFLNGLSISSFGSYNAATVNSTQVNKLQVDLRGLGSDNTLVLLDGRRMQDEGGEGVVDISTIPIAAIERVEILKDSASAIYGSDATAGVVNIITRKDFDGSAFTIKWLEPDGKGGSERVLSAAFGTSTDRYRTLTTFSSREKSATYYRDREWTKVGESSFSLPANYTDTGIDDFGVQPHPNCPENRIGGAGFCVYDFAATSALTPRIEELSFLNNFEYNINENMSFISSLRANRSLTKWNMAPNADDFVLNKASVDATEDPQAIWDYLGIEEPEGDLLIRYRGVPYGLREFEESKDSYGAVFGLRGTLSDWDWEVTANQSKSRLFRFNENGWFFNSGLVTAILEQRFNPFNESVDAKTQKVVDDTKYQGYEIIDTESEGANVIVSGELGQLPGGPIGLAFGVDYTKSKFNYFIDHQSEQGNVIGTQPSEGSEAYRDIKAAFAEMRFPIANSIETQLAVRFDDYNDFGSTVNPKAGFSIRPFDGLLFRGNVATGFKAPTLRELHGGASINFQDVVDRPRCITLGIDPNSDACEITTEVKIIESGNDKLKEETSLSWNLGAVYSVNADLSFTVDYWNTEIEDVITAVDIQDLADAVAEGLTPPDGVQYDRLTGDDTPFGSAQLESITLPQVNLGKKRDAGIDFGLSYRVNVSDINILLTSDYARRTINKAILVPNGDFEENLDKRDFPKWRMSNDIKVNKGNYSLSLKRKDIAGFKNEKETGRVGSFSTYDMQVAVNTPYNARLTLGAINLFNKKFPLDESSRVGDDQRVQTLYPIDQRVTYLQVDYSF